jgi:acetoin utilization protein AcuB
MTALLIKDVMTPAPHTIGIGLSLADAARLMKKYDIRHLPVLDSGSLVGVLSDRDVKLLSSISPLDPTCILVEDAMTQAPWTVKPQKSVAEVAREMAKKKIGCAVVLDPNERVIGVFTTIDALEVLAHEKPKRRPAPRKSERARA